MGKDKELFSIRINVSIEKREPIGFTERLSVNEELIVDSLDFVRACEILGKFHELAKRCTQ